jgi:branched-chain amino acid transport system permease protein
VTVASRLALAAAVLAAFALAPAWVNPGLLFVIGLTLIQALFALSWNLLFRYAGLASFGHAMFFGIGAYATAAVIFHHLPVPFLAAVVLAAALGGLAALVVGLVVLPRTTGIQLAVLTLALSQLALLFVSYSNFLGRDEGLSGLARPRLDLGVVAVDLATPARYYWFILAVCTLAAAVLLWFVSGPRGRTLLAVRIDPERAAFVGIDVLRQRVLAFTLAGALAALAGALVAPWSQIVATDTMSWLTSAQPMLATLLGGTGSFWGPAIGAFALALLGYFTRSFAGLSELVVGGILLVVVLVAPAGLTGLLGAGLLRTGRRPDGRAAPAPPAGGAP